MLYNLSKPVLDLNLQEIPDAPGVNILLANTLANSNKLNPLKAMGWALSLSKDGTIEIDDVDKKTLTDFIEANEQLPNLTKYAIIKALEKSE